MESGPPSERDRISHSTPKGSLSPSTTGRQSKDSRSNRNGYTNTFQSSSASIPVTDAPQSGRKVESQNLEETGESTRSLLSVLSHSSVDSLSTGSISASNSVKSSPERTETRTESRVGLDQTHNITNSQTSVQEEHADASTPSPWEKWLIEKTKLEREQICAAIQKNLSEVKARKEKEERDKEKRRHVEERVLAWLKQKEREEKKKRTAERKKKREEQAEKQMGEKKIAAKAKVGREEWLSHKKERERKGKEQVDQEKREKALEERLKKEKAEEAFKKWKKESRDRPQPPTGSVFGKGGSSYPVPAFINPVPWRPNETSTPLNSTRKKGSARKKNSASLPKAMVVESPPLLFKNRSKKDNIRPPGRRR